MIWFKKNYLFYFLLTNDLYYSKNNDIFKSYTKIRITKNIKQKNKE